MVDVKDLKLFGVGPYDLINPVPRPAPAVMDLKLAQRETGLVSYNDHIRAVVEAATVSERKYDHCRLREAIAEFRSTPAPKPDSMILPWCVLLFAIGAVVYFLTELPEMVRVLAGG